MRKLAVTLVTCSVLAAAGVSTATGAPRFPHPHVNRSQVPPFPPEPPGWTHADVNVTIRGKQHTLTVDRGVIRQVSATQLTLREHGGVTVVMPLSGQAIVTVNGKRATIFQLKRRMKAQTMRIDGGAAMRVRATR
jgi:hypothetical protein